MEKKLIKNQETSKKLSNLIKVIENDFALCGGGCNCNCYCYALQGGDVETTSASAGVRG